MSSLSTVAFHPRGVLRVSRGASTGGRGSCFDKGVGIGRSAAEVGRGFFGRGDGSGLAALVGEGGWTEREKGAAGEEEVRRRGVDPSVIVGRPATSVGRYSIIWWLCFLTASYAQSYRSICSAISRSCIFSNEALSSLVYL